MIDVSNSLMISAIDVECRNVSSSGIMSFRIETISIAVKELIKAVYSSFIRISCSKKSIRSYILNCFNNVISLEYSN